MANVPNIYPFEAFNTADISDRNQRWERWRKKIKRFIIAHGITDETVKLSHLWLAGGDDLEDVFETVKQETDITLKAVLDRLSTNRQLRAQHVQLSQVRAAKSSTTSLPV